MASVDGDSLMLGRCGGALIDTEGNLIENFDGKHRLTLEDSDSKSSCETGMAYLILILLVAKLVLAFKKIKARELKAVVQKNVGISTLLKTAILVSALGLLTCGIADDESKVSCTGQTCLDCCYIVAPGTPSHTSCFHASLSP